MILALVFWFLYLLDVTSQSIGMRLFNAMCHLNMMIRARNMPGKRLEMHTNMHTLCKNITIRAPMVIIDLNG